MTLAERVGARLTGRGEWQAGMLTTAGQRIEHVYDDRTSCTMCGGAYIDGPIAPDLTDWPTLGVLVGAIIAAGHFCEIAFDEAGYFYVGSEYGNTAGEAIGALYLTVTEPGA